MSAFGGPNTNIDDLIFFVDFSNIKSYDGVSSTGNSLVGDNTISLLNSATFSSAAGGSLVTSDGGNIAISGQNISYSGNDFTWDVWFLRSQYSGLDIIMGNVYPYISFINNNSIRVYIRIGNTYYSFDYNYTPQNNIWYNITLVNYYDSGQNVTTDDIYLNGQYLYSGTASGILSDYSNYPLVIGSYFNFDNNNSCLNGIISSVKVYDRDLSAEEILKNYESVKSKYGH